MGGRKAVDALIEGRGKIAGFKIFEKIADPRFIDPERDRGMIGHRIGIGCKGKNLAGRVMIDQLPHPHLIAGTEQTLARRIPDGEGKIAEQVSEAGGAPSQIGAQHQFAVTNHPPGIG